MYINVVSQHFQPVLALLVCRTGISPAQWSSRGYQEGHPWMNNENSHMDLGMLGNGISRPILLQQWEQ